MKKLLVLMAALMLGANAFADLTPAPDDATLNGYAEAGQNLVYAIYVEDSIKCNDIVLVGTYNGWTGDAASCSTFVAVGGFAGWYVCCVADASEDIQAKPVQLDDAGAFNWDYQVGKLEQNAVVRGTATIVPGFGDECDIKAISDAAPLLIQVNSWKNRPCTAVYHDYIITLISPDCNEQEYITPAISGGFNAWAQEAMTFDAAATYTRQQGFLPGGVYKDTVHAAEGTEYKFRSSEEWGEGWTNVLRQYNTEAGEWEAFNGGSNFTFGTSTEIKYDLGDPTMYSWTNCERPSGNEKPVITGVTLTGYTGVYDGQGHAVQVSGTEAGDVICFSADSTTWQLANPSFKNVVDTLIYARVQRTGCKDWGGSAKVVITKRDITLQSASLDKEYDGTAITAYSNPGGTTITDVNGSYVSGEKFNYYFTDSQLGVGESDNSFSVSDSETALAANYNVTKQYGTLSVTKRTAPITITANSDSKTYTGTALTNDEYSVSGTLGANDQLSAVVSGTITAVGTIANKVTVYTILHNDIDITDYYANVCLADGTLEITPATLTVTGTTAAEKVYDGTTDAEVTAGMLEGVIGNDEVNIESATGTFADKNAGEYKEVTVTYTLSGNDAANYSIEEGQTTANITPREITLQSADVVKKYDGKALTAYSKDSGTVIADVNASYVAGECLSYAFTGSQLAVGSSPSTFIASNNDSTNVNNYDVTSLYGTLTVIPTDTLISITADSDSKIYDGTPLADAGYTVSGTLGAGDYVSDVVNEGIITNVGTVPNKVNGYKIFNNAGEDVTSFYTNVQTVDGTLTVKRIIEDPITVSVISDSKKYDGKALNIGYTYSDKLLDGDVLGATFNVDYRVDAGFDTVNITNVRIMRGDLDVTGGYLIDTLIPGYIEVLPRTIVLTSASVTRSYDGTALTASDVTIGGDGLAKGDGIDFNVTGSQTRIGSSDNTFSYSFKPGTRSSNYIVESGFGTLTVNPISLVPVTVTVSKLSKKYDGTPLASEYTSTAELQEGDILEVMLSADSRTDAGKDDVSVGNIRIMRGMQDVTEGYTFGQIVSGSIEIKPRTLVLTSGSASKLFDGTALTDTTFTIDGDGLAKGEGLAVDFTGAQTKVGSSYNAFAYTFKPGTKAGNYDVETAFGVLEVENSVSPAITGNYDKWTIVLETVALESALAKLGVNATVKAGNVRWFKVSGSDADAVDMYTGIHTGNDSATNPATGLTHSETVVMDGQYYAVVYVPEAESVMGISYFMTNVVLMDGKLSPVHMHGADSDGSLGYDLNGRPVNDGYDGITIYRNGQKIYR